MTAPMAVVSLISWLKNPYEKGKTEVRVATITKKDISLLITLTPLITLIFFFILKFFGTANLLVSTLSVTTTFAAVFLTYKRSKYFTLAYAVNDVVLITLWTLAAIHDVSYLSVIICFVAFLANDIYGFISWQRMEKKQHGCPQDT
jgi:nicotinamide riboside transporter PnuC